MDFALSNESQALLEQTEQFAREQLPSPPPGEEPSFSRDAWVACARFGIQGAYVPRELGGQGHGVETTIAMLEGLGRGCRDNGFTLGINGHMWAVMEPILRFGSAEQRQRFLPGLCNGDLIGAHGMTETESGSDAFSLQTTALARDGGYVLNGRKSYIGLAPACDLALVFASTDPSVGQWGVSAFIVESGRDGFEASATRVKMGLSGSPLGDIAFEDCFVPAENRLGPEGAGVSIFNQSMEWERSFIFASHVGAMARQLDEALTYVNKRRQFGRPIAQFQSVSNRIADMKLRLETSRLLLYRAAWQKQQGQSNALDAALTKLHLSESLVDSSMDAVRVHGALGYLREGGVERDLRDTIGGITYSGTSDIQRQLVARLLGL